MAKIVIGIDESYTRTGITVLEDKKLIKMYSVNFDGCKNNYDKRKELRSVLESILNKLLRKYKPIEIKCIIERIRTFSGGHMSSQYLITTGGLIVTILDVFLEHGIKVYSVDTKSWKNAVVGTSKPKENKYGINPNKYPTIQYLKMKGLLKKIVIPYKGRGTKGIVNVRINGVKTPCKINDDIADAYCIACYGFIHPTMQKLKEENF
nr:MAG TPA: HOLLIDAY JUNCTION RESOLVASE [Bacteriophage sp.]